MRNSNKFQIVIPLNTKAVFATFAAILPVALALTLPPRAAAALPVAQGFAVERWYPSSPGAAWLVADDINQGGRLGGILSATGGVAQQPLVAGSGSNALAAVQRQSQVGIALGVTYDRFRLSLRLNSPVQGYGQSGTVGGYTYIAPQVTLGSHPDTFSDVTIGLDARWLGTPGSALRLGASAQLVVPSGDRRDYLTDGTFRAFGRLLVAGDHGSLMYAGSLGIHVRPLQSAAPPSSPKGHEIVFAAAIGGKAWTTQHAQLSVGPEVFGATALSDLLGAQSTAVEALLSARWEQTEVVGARWRAKLGIGVGIVHAFGAPMWRTVLAIESLQRAEGPVKHNSNVATVAEEDGHDPQAK